MKKIMLCLLLVSFFSLPIYSLPTDEEVAKSFTGVFGVYGALFFMAMMGQETPGAVMDMDMETGASTLTFDNLDAVSLLKAIEEPADGSGELPELVFTHISGLFTTDTEGNLDMDVTLTGGPVNHLEMKTKGEELVYLKADGKTYDNLDAFNNL